MDYNNVFGGVFGESDSLKSKLINELNQDAYESFLASFSTVLNSKKTLSDKIIKNYNRIDFEIDKYLKAKPSKIDGMKFIAKKLNPNGIKHHVDEMISVCDLKNEYRNLNEQLIMEGFGHQLQQLKFDDIVFTNISNLIVPEDHEFYSAYKSYINIYKNYLATIKKYSVEAKDNRIIRAIAGSAGTFVGFVTGTPFVGTTVKEFFSKEGNIKEFLECYKNTCDAYDNLTNMLLDFVEVCLENYRHILFVLYGGLLLECNRIQNAKGREIVEFDIEKMCVVACFTEDERKRIKEWFLEQFTKSYALALSGSYQDAINAAQGLFYKTLHSSEHKNMAIEQIGDIIFSDDKDSDKVNHQRMAYSLCSLVENFRLKKYMVDPAKYVTETKKFLSSMIMIPCDLHFDRKHPEKERVSIFEVISNFIHFSIVMNSNSNLDVFADILERYLNNNYAEELINNENISSYTQNQLYNTMLLITREFGVLIQLGSLYYSDKQGVDIKSSHIVNQLLKNVVQK